MSAPVRDCHNCAHAVLTDKIRCPKRKAGMAADQEVLGWFFNPATRLDTRSGNCIGATECPAWTAKENT